MIHSASGPISSPETMHSDLSRDQHVELFPSYVYFDVETKQWMLLFSGFVYRAGQDGVRRRVFLRVLQQVLDVTEEQLWASDQFKERIVGFLNAPQRGSSVAVSVDDGNLIAIERSGRSGHVRFSIPIPEANVPAERTSLQQSTENGSWPYRIALPSGDTREIAANAEIISPKGVSVVTDIDDTIKISQVAHRRQLLHNTFVHPFAAVPGMAQIYSKWRNAGVSFHYVSSSPWQLYQPLHKFLNKHKFPSGSFHLRSYRFGDPSVLKLFMSRKRNKFKIIETILQQFPGRQFIFVGDSGEKDAEVYGKVARKFPQQTKQILIRLVDGRPWTKKRVAKAFRHVPEDRWQAFRVPTQIRDMDLG